MHSSRPIFGVAMTVVFMATGCNSRPAPTLQPTAEKWDFAHGFGDWRSHYSEEVELVRDGDMAYLSLHTTKKRRYGCTINKTIHLGQRRAENASMYVIAKALVSPTEISLHFECRTGNQEDRPPYGVLAAGSMDCRLTSDWTTYKMTFEVPKGTREVLLSVGINLPKSAESSSVDIRSIEYRIDE